MNFPKYDMSMQLTHNRHKNYYQTAEQAIASGDYDEGSWVSPEQKQKAIDTDQIWRLQWWQTAVTSFVLHAADLDVLLAAATAGNESP